MTINDFVQYTDYLVVDFSPIFYCLPKPLFLYQVWFNGTTIDIISTILVTMYYSVVVVVFFTLTDRASTIPSNIRGCQSGTWSQRGTEVNGSHHGDNPLLGPTGIQIATKSYATLQAMAPTNNKTVHQTFLYSISRAASIDSDCGPRIVVAYPRPAFSATNRTNTFQPVLINNIPSFSRPHIVQK